MTAVDNTETLVVADPRMHAIYGLVQQLGPADLPVLITGETGCGKELVATELHRRSHRASQPLVSVNCAAIQASLVESELFGHEKGSFTGAVATRKGYLEAAAGSTIFLDEVGELPLALQAKLLRVLETKKITRVGDTRERDVDVRVVAATNRDLLAEISRGTFRRDLYYRLGAATLQLPPLRERPLELELLARSFLAKACAQARKATKELSSEAIARLREHSWPGNVRELKNAMMYVAATTDAETVAASDLDDALGAPRADGHGAFLDESTPLDIRRADIAPLEGGTPTFRPLAEELSELEATRIREALEATNGNQSAAAALLSVPIRTFFGKVKTLGLRSHVKPRRHH